MRASGYDRAAEDWYVEPGFLVDALVASERAFEGRVWDPFCGGGNIPRRLRAAGVDAFGTDLVDRGGQGCGGWDFFSSAASAASIVSNPPFSRLQEAARRALSLATDRVCLLGRLAFLEGQERGSGLWRETPLARVWVSSRRASMPPGGTDLKAQGGTIPFAWFVFEHGFIGAPTLGWV